MFVHVPVHMGKGQHSMLGYSLDPGTLELTGLLGLQMHTATWMLEICTRVSVLAQSALSATEPALQPLE